MTCCSREQLVRLARNDLAEAEAAAVHAHLATCTHCRGEFDLAREHLRPSAGSSSDTTATRALGRTHASPAEPAHEPESFGAAAVEGYEIINEIHRGGQGIVYRAIQKSTRRVVALKILRQTRGAGTRQRERFDREIELIARLNHPNIVTVYDGRADQDVCFLAMKYVEGRRLDDFLDQDQPGVDRILLIMQQISAAVDYALRCGIIHRDLKPANILIDAEGKPIILDFGLAKVVAAPTDAGHLQTITGEFMGTIAYAAPEQLRADPAQIDGRSDVYALGVILFRALTGRRPYETTGDLTEFINLMARQRPPNPSSLRPQVSPELDIIVQRAMAQEPERRYQTAGELADDLERHQHGMPIRARRDDTWYVLRRHARSQARRHPAFVLAAIGLLALALAVLVFDPLVTRWTPVNSIFTSAMTNWFCPTTPGGKLPHVCMVGFTDKTDIDALGREQRLEDVSSWNLVSARRLHGRLMEQLARAGPKVVAWDISFTHESPFDEDFVAGVSALRQADIPVVVASKTWWLGDQETPRLSGVIARHVRVGAITANLGSAAPWRIDCVARRGSLRTLPSLALMTVGAFRRPDCDVELLLRPEDVSVELHYWKQDLDFGTRISAGPPDRIVLTDVGTVTRSAEEVRLAKGDLVGGYMFSVPGDDVLAASTQEYGEVLRASDAQRLAWFEDRVVLLADFRAKSDSYAHPDGRTLFGVDAHAIAIEAILGRLEVPRRVQPFRLEQIDASAGVLTGIALAALAAFARRRRLVLMALIALFCVAASLLLATTEQIAWNPLVAFAALVVASEASAPVWRLARLKKNSN